MRECSADAESAWQSRGCLEPRAIRSTMRSLSNCSMSSAQAGPITSLLHAQLPVMGEELSRIGWKVLQDRAPITVTARAHVYGDEPIVLEDRYGDIGRMFRCLRES